LTGIIQYFLNSLSFNSPLIGYSKHSRNISTFVSPSLEHLAVEQELLRRKAFEELGS